MLDTDEFSSSSSPSVPTTENLPSPVTPMQDSGAMRALLTTQQLRESLLARKLLLPDTSSLVPLWRSSYSLLASSLGESLCQSIPSFIQPIQEATASIGSVFASRLFAETRGIGAMASAAAQIKAAVSPSISFIQRERPVLQNIFPSSKVLEHLLAPMDFSHGMLIKNFLSSQGLLLQRVGDFSHRLNASLLTLTHWLPERLRQVGEWFKLRLLTAFQHAKLCLAPSLSEDVMYQIMGYVEAGDLRPVTMLLWSYYARNRHMRLRQAVNSWFDHPEFAARRHIFEEAFASHCDRRYVASIRMLTPEIEGLGSCTVRTYNLRAVNKRGQDLGLRLGKARSVVHRMVDAAEDTDPGLLHWVRVRSAHTYLDGFVAETDFERDYDQVRNHRAVNRHGIAHGFQIQGYAWLNSLRLFLLLDTIHYLLRAPIKGTITSGITV